MKNNFTLFIYICSWLFAFQLLYCVGVLGIMSMRFRIHMLTKNVISGKLNIILSSNILNVWYWSYIQLDSVPVYSAIHNRHISKKTGSRFFLWLSLTLVLPEFHVLARTTLLSFVLYIKTIDLLKRHLCIWSHYLVYDYMYFFILNFIDFLWQRKHYKCAYQNMQLHDSIIKKSVCYIWNYNSFCFLMSLDILYFSLSSSRRRRK